MPATCGVDLTLNGAAPDALPQATVIRTSASMYQSLRELSSNYNTSDAAASSAPGDITLNYRHHTSTTSNSSDYTDDDEETEEDGSSGTGTGSSFRRRRRFRYVEPSGPSDGSEAAPSGYSNNNNNNNNNTSSSRTLPSIRESCLSTCKSFNYSPLLETS